jgi:hypothetical protein
MGIRIHRMIGYGLIDLKCDRKGKISDPRIAPDSVLEADRKEFDHFNRENYLKFCKKNAKGWEFDLMLEIDFLKKKANHWDWYYSFCHQSEFGLPNVLCITPACCKDWKQYDNTIDYYDAIVESRKSRKYMRNSVDVLENGIYPYISQYIDRRDGRDLESTFACAFWQMTNAQRDAKKRRKDASFYNGNQLAQKIGFKDAEDALENMRPKQPDMIVNLCRFGKLFNDESTIRDLVPMLYTYWS